VLHGGSEAACATRAGRAYVDRRACERLMRIIGLDPSSTICGYAVIDTPDQIESVGHWKRDKTKSHPEGMRNYFFFLAQIIQRHKPQMAVIEMSAYGAGVKANFQAAQAVAFYQGVSAVCCKLNGLIVVETRATSARKAALGNGGLAKDAVWEIMRKRYSDLFSAKTSGGLDECDALVLALAGPTVAER
jgi:Holliday junction resolvasome RuvABC endonuclease subunit